MDEEPDTSLKEKLVAEIETSREKSGQQNVGAMINRVLREQRKEEINYTLLSQ